MSDVRSRTDELRRLPLQVHAFLHDVPLHDVSMIDLPGGGANRTIADVEALIPPEGLMSTNPAVRALFGIRRMLGRLFGWDEASPSARRESYVDRLPEEIRARSTVTPGTPHGLFTVVYRLEHEALAEIRNATAHAFLCSVLEARGDGYRLYWAVYVKPVSWLTPVYMGLIEPFRRFIVYPSVLGRIRSAWIARFGGAAG